MDNTQLVSLSDKQMDAVMRAASLLQDPKMRSNFLRSIANRLDGNAFGGCSDHEVIESIATVLNAYGYCGGNQALPTIRHRRKKHAEELKSTNTGR